MSGLPALLARYPDATRQAGGWVLPVAGPAAHALSAEIRRVGRDGGWISVQVRSQQRVARDHWPAAVRSCNEWNSRPGTAKAFVDTEPGDPGPDAPVVLEGCLPGPLTPPVFDALLRSVADGAVDFWRWADLHADW